MITAYDWRYANNLRRLHAEVLDFRASYSRLGFDLLAMKKLDDPGVVKSGEVLACEIDKLVAIVRELMDEAQAPISARQ